jgi:hypothetical protein
MACAMQHQTRDIFVNQFLGPACSCWSAVLYIILRTCGSFPALTWLHGARCCLGGAESRVTNRRELWLMSALGANSVAKRKYIDGKAACFELFSGVVHFSINCMMVSGVRMRDAAVCRLGAARVTLLTLMGFLPMCICLLHDSSSSIFREQKIRVYREAFVFSDDSSGLL